MKKKIIIAVTMSLVVAMVTPVCSFAETVQVTANEVTVDTTKIQGLINEGEGLSDYSSVDAYVWVSNVKNYISGINVSYKDEIISLCEAAQGHVSIDTFNEANKILAYLKYIIEEQSKQQYSEAFLIDKGEKLTKYNSSDAFLWVLETLSFIEQHQENKNYDNIKSLCKAALGHVSIDTFNEANKILAYLKTMHIWQEGEITVQPTCTDTGIRTDTCMDEGCTETKEVILPALGHDYTDEITTEATCTTEGIRTFTCSRCGDTYTEIINATGHSFGEWTEVTSPTCTDKGSEQRVCSICETVETKDIDPKGHTYGAWEITKASTVFKTGVKTKTCTVCGDNQTKTISKLTPTIKLSATNKTIKAKKSYTLKISKLAKGDSVKSVVSSSKKIAKIKKTKTNQYKITGVKKGKATITVKLKSGKTKKMKVTVK